VVVVVHIISLARFAHNCTKELIQAMITIVIDIGQCLSPRAVSVHGKTPTADISKTWLTGAETSAETRAKTTANNKAEHAAAETTNPTGMRRPKGEWMKRRPVETTNRLTSGQSEEGEATQGAGHVSQRRLAFRQRDRAANDRKLQRLQRRMPTNELRRRTSDRKPP